MRKKAAVVLSMEMLTADTAACVAKFIPLARRLIAGSESTRRKYRSELSGEPGVGIFHTSTLAYSLLADLSTDPENKLEQFRVSVHAYRVFASQRRFSATPAPKSDRFEATIGHEIPRTLTSPRLKGIASTASHETRRLSHLLIRVADLELISQTGARE